MENKYYEMNIAGCIRRLPRIRITDSMEIASFVLLGDAELVVKAAAELVKKVPEVDYLITAEEKGCLLYTSTPKDLQYIMGHSNISIKMNWYANASLDTAKSEVQRLIA